MSSKIPRAMIEGFREPPHCPDFQSAAYQTMTLKFAGVRAANFNHQLLATLPFRLAMRGLEWVDLKELKISYYNKETLLFTVYPYYGHVIEVP